MFYLLFPPLDAFTHHALDVLDAPAAHQRQSALNYLSQKWIFLIGHDQFIISVGRASQLSRVFSSLLLSARSHFYVFHNGVGSWCYQSYYSVWKQLCWQNWWAQTF